VAKIGIVGSLVWDRIYGRDPLAPPVEEWGGIAYALAGLDAALPPGWEIVPLIKVGRDLSARAQELLRTLTRLAPGTRCVEVTAPNNRVVLHYRSAERRTERMAGGVPAWTWGELGPMVQDLDAVYVNFISGFELALGTARALRQGFAGLIYADLHSLLLGMQHDGVRMLRPLPDAAEWFGCFDVVQLNEDEMRQLSPDPMTLSVQALEAGVRLLIVTLGARGAAYVAAGGPGAPVQSALVPAPTTEVADPTGCGDVFGATACARLLAGDSLDDVLRRANGAAARSAGYRGATGLARHLRGELVAL
jgi:hypothetical protein